MDNLIPTDRPCFLSRVLWLSPSLLAPHLHSLVLPASLYLTNAPSFEFYSRIFHPLQFLSPRQVLHTPQETTGLPRCFHSPLSGHSFVVARRTQGAAISSTQAAHPPLLCAALCRRHHLKPATGGTPPPLFTWGILPLILLPAGD